MGLRSSCVVALAVLPLACSSKGEPDQKQPPSKPEPAVAKVDAAPLPPPAPLPPLATDEGGGTGAPRWGVGFGGLGSDVARDLAVDPKGDVFVCGDFEDEATFAALGKQTTAGKSDGFVARVGADGTPAWIRTLGGENEETCESVALAGDVVAIGGLYSSTLKSGELTAKAFGSDDLYVAAYAPDGTPKWLWTTGGKASDAVLALAPAGDGGFIAAGSFHGTVPFGDTELVAKSREDAFVAKLSAGGEVEWAKRYGGDRDERIVSVAVDPQGSILALVAFEWTSDFGGEPMKSAGGYDIAVVKLDRRGEHVWSHRFGGVDNEGAGGVAVDPAGNVTIVGSYDQKIVVGKDEYRAAGTSDLLIARFAPDGALQWARSIGGKGEDVMVGVDADPAGNVVIGGWFEHEVDFGKGKVKSRGNKDLVVMKLDPAGAVRWVQTFGGKDHDKVRATAIAPDGSIYVAGVFRFELNLPTPIESVRAPADRAPKTDAYLMHLER